MVVNKNILTYSIISIVIIITGLAISCNRGSSLDGSWSLSDKQPACAKKFSFLNKNTISFVTSDSSSSLAGTYKEIENNKYKLDFKVYSKVTLIKQSGNTMTVQDEGDSGVCTYKRD
ncbi:hypothetical protein J2Z48_002955 [Croceifilum oryzae]|uniref:Lipoprotein n=1 Tax=Croceifilum oryzae TaxID=1553429 RepID=A0AAJ1WV84_9BACL|nr:hypothetical protein [Croceifilum oryzae]